MALQKLQMNIDGMHCSECASGIRLVAELIDGVRAVDVDFARQEIAGEFDDDNVEREAIVREIESIGYRIRPT